MIPTITQQQKQQLDEQGFTILENVFTVEDMEHIGTVIETFQKRHQETLEADNQANSEEGINISRASEITFTDHLAENSPEVREFCTRPEFVSIAAELLGPDVDLYWNQSVFKSPEGEKEFPWHQDDGYSAVDPSPYLTLWIALNDATPENGCISAMPGSHKNGLVAHTPSPIGLVCHSSDDPDQGVQVPVKAGSIAVFWSLTFHKSGVNRSKGMRKAFIAQYCHAGLRKVDTGEVIPNLIPVVRSGRAAELAKT